MAAAGEESLHRLSGTSPGGEAGGLVLRPRGAEQHVFKAPAPRVSLLGLDVLAAQKRRERQEEAAGGKRSRVASYKDWEEGRDEAGSAEEEEEDEASRSSRGARRNRWRLQGIPGAGRVGSAGWAQPVTGSAAAAAADRGGLRGVVAQAAAGALRGQLKSSSYSAFLRIFSLCFACPDITALST